MKKLYLIIILLLGLLFTFSTGVLASNWGSGNLAAEKRNVAGFHSIELSGTGTVYLQQGTEQSLEVKTDDNLLKKLETVVTNGKLRIGFKHGVRHVTRLDVYITMKELKEITISGSGNIQGKGVFKASDLGLKIDGSGDITLELDAQNITAAISGSGDINLKGKAVTEEISINGSGDYYGFDLTAEKAGVEIRGSGDCKISVAQELNAELYGSGVVEYRGRPAVNTRVYGSGSVRANN